MNLGFNGTGNLEPIGDEIDFDAMDQRLLPERTDGANLLISALPLLLGRAGSKRSRLAVIAKVLECDERSQAEIARSEGLTRQEVHREIAAGRAYLRAQFIESVATLPQATKPFKG